MQTICQQTHKKSKKRPTFQTHNQDSVAPFASQEKKALPKALPKRSEKRIMPPKNVDTPLISEEDLNLVSFIRASDTPEEQQQPCGMVSRTTWIPCGPYVSRRHIVEVGDQIWPPKTPGNNGKGKGKCLEPPSVVVTNTTTTTTATTTTTSTTTHVVAEPQLLPPPWNRTPDTASQQPPLPQKPVPKTRPHTIIQGPLVPHTKAIPTIEPPLHEQVR